MRQAQHSRVATLAAIMLLPALACEADHTATSAPGVEIRGQRIQVEIVRSREDQTRGLGDRDSLDWGRGMLFIYEEAGFYSFWMKAMRFDIDIVWIRAGRIVDIAHLVKHSPTGPGPTYRPREVADQVLEVPAGFAAAHGWRKNDVVKVDLGGAQGHQKP